MAYQASQGWQRQVVAQGFVCFAQAGRSTGTGSGFWQGDIRVKVEEQRSATEKSQHLGLDRSQDQLLGKLVSVANIGGHPLDESQHFFLIILLLLAARLRQVPGNSLIQTSDNLNQSCQGAESQDVVIVRSELGAALFLENWEACHQDDQKIEDINLQDVLEHAGLVWIMVGSCQHGQNVQTVGSEQVLENLRDHDKVGQRHC